MRFYTQQHLFYCGVDLHARSLYLCVLDRAGEVRLHRGVRRPRRRSSRPSPPTATISSSPSIAFVLGHALYMKAIHGGKANSDRIDARKVAVVLRGGMIRQAYVYPPEMRATRDLPRRRLHFTGKRAELLTHIENTNSQYNLPPFCKEAHLPRRPPRPVL